MSCVGLCCLKNNGTVRNFNWTCTCGVILKHLSDQEDMRNLKGESLETTPTVPLIKMLKC